MNEKNTIYFLKANEMEEKDPLPSARDPLSTPRVICNLLAQGMYPTMRIIDIRTNGFNRALGKRRWWQLFNIETYHCFV